MSRIKQAIGILAATIAFVSVSTLESQGNSTLTLITHDSFNYSPEIMEAFSDATGISVEVLRLGDAGLLVNQALLTKENPLGDVLFGIDNTFLSRALEEDLFISYQSPLLEQVDPSLILDLDHRVTPITFGDVCLNYDAEFFATRDIAVPSGLADLTQPQYRSMLVVQNPSTSSPGLAFLLTTIGVFGTEDDYTYLDYWRDLVANDVFISDAWEDSYYTQFSGSTGSTGNRPLVVSYASSPPAEVYFAEAPPATPPTAAITADDTCFRQIEFAGILEGTPNLESAQLFIDFLLSKPFQEDMPLSMFVFPVTSLATLPDVFMEYASIAENPITMQPTDIETNREEWIEAWTELVLR
jgi:thiamine transport system substrate-binding protein